MAVGNYPPNVLIKEIMSVGALLSSHRRHVCSAVQRIYVVGEPEMWGRVRR